MLSFLADNKLAQNAGWDAEMLRLELEALAAEKFDLDLTGFDERELSELIQSERQMSSRRSSGSRGASRQQTRRSMEAGRSLPAVRRCNNE